MASVSVIIPGRCEQHFQQTIDSVLEAATGDVEVVAVVDGYTPDPPLRTGDPRLKVVTLDKAIGQRAAYNRGVQESSGKYLMKLDAHAKVSKGFDEILASHCPDDAVILPEMRRLDARRWKDKARGKTHFMNFGLDLYCHYWKDYRRRPEAQGEYPEVMTGQGSCWFTTRKWNDYIGLLNEEAGSWGNVGIEVSLRTWLCGGQQLLNRNAWQAHWFRVDDGGFPYPMSGRQVAKAHRYTWDHCYFKDDAFEHQIRPFGWLIEKFAPVSSWEVYLNDAYTAPRVIVYYTDSQLEPSLARAVRNRIDKVAGPIPIISVSQDPLEFGKNICVGKKPHAMQSMYEQIAAGVQATEPGSVVYLCEHDVFYHYSHFAMVPKDKRAICFNRNRYFWRSGLPTFWRAHGTRALSQGICYREYLLEHVQARIEDLKKDPGSKMNCRWHRWSSDRPNVDVRHGDNLTRDLGDRKEYLKREKQGVKNLPGWGGVKHFSSAVSYRGTSRVDVLQFLVKRYKFDSYLEIGVGRYDKTFKHIPCKHKTGVDPQTKSRLRMTSDEFFADNQTSYDLIFIDGLHEAEQVLRDIQNSLTWLNPGGVIVVHDCNPETEAEQSAERNRRKTWTGDGWKAFVAYRRHSELEMYTVDANNGCGVIRRGEQEPLLVLNPTYADFAKHREKWLNLKTVAEFKTWERERGQPKPLRRHEPVDESAMDEKHRTNTICETLRSIYHELDDEALRLRVRVAMAMAKAMVARLQKYQRDWDRGFWDKA